MGYIKALEILPEEIVRLIQNYIDGEIIYIPKRNERRKSWGECTDTKIILSTRNASIYKDYQNGLTLRQLSDKYYLVEKSIQRILRDERNRLL